MRYAIAPIWAKPFLFLDPWVRSLRNVPTKTGDRARAHADVAKLSSHILKDIGLWDREADEG